MPTAEDDVLVASIDELVHTFHAALVALVPVAERAKLTWAETMDQHHSWEKLQACLFDVFVRQPISADQDRVAGEFRLPPYDIDLDDYASTSWLSCRTESETDMAFVRFVTHDQPFDTVQGVEIAPTSHKAGRSIEIPLTSARFSYLRRTPDGSMERIHGIEATE
jgi:hypothetical protein